MASLGRTLKSLECLRCRNSHVYQPKFFVLGWKWKVENRASVKSITVSYECLSSSVQFWIERSVSWAVCLSLCKQRLRLLLLFSSFGWKEIAVLRCLDTLVKHFLKFFEIGKKEGWKGGSKHRKQPRFFFYSTHRRQRNEQSPWILAIRPQIMSMMITIKKVCLKF